MIISFLGSLPLGILNLLVTYVTVSNGVLAALSFAAGCILSELIFVWLLLISLNRVSNRQKLFRVLEWITVVIILIMAGFSIKAALMQTGFTSAMPATINHPFWSGVLISAVDPMKIPFWFLWSTCLISNRVLIMQKNYFIYYITGIGIGSFLGFWIFIYGGNYLIASFKSHQDIINWFVGIILLLTVIIQIYRMYKRKENESATIE